MNAHVLSGASQTPHWKRSTDVVLCIVALPILALLTVIMTIVIQLYSPGPVFFRQERIGYRGRRFLCYKFRTMEVAADSRVHQRYVAAIIGANAPMEKIDVRGDSRLIPAARLMRASGLDELPQIINVLKGEMSLVGPRPCIPYEYRIYQPWQRERFETLPGLTGLWQVSGKNDTTFEQMMRLDIRYVRTKSWREDIRIIFLTLPVVAMQSYSILRSKRKAKQAGIVLAAPIGGVSRKAARDQVGA